MPEGLEQLVSRQGLADLFAFLALDSPPGDAGGDALPIPGAPAWLESWVAAPPAGAAEASGGGRGE
jgi:hypothetical protein